MEDRRGMNLPLASLLSRALVAFTVEFDNEFEHRMPHSTTRHHTASGSRSGPWLVSMVMWWNCMRFVGDEGVAAGKLESLARTATNLNGMERWGYITVAPDPADKRAKPPRAGWIIRATPKGRQAREIWQGLFDVIEERWRERFGEESIARLRERLCAVIANIEIELPDCLPILGYGLFSRMTQRAGGNPAGSAGETTSDLPLPALLAKVLLKFALEFEHDSEVSLAISANLLRIVGEDGVRVRELPRLSGVSKEAIAMSISFAEKRGFAKVRPDSSGSRVKVIELTSRGRHARDDYGRRLGALEERWQSRMGKNTIVSLHHSLQTLAGEPDQLFRGWEPYPDGWRTSVARPVELPHYPMILHRGGFPDGS